MLKFKREHETMIRLGSKRELRRLAPLGVDVGEVHEAWAYEPGTTRACTFCWGQFMDPVDNLKACRWCGGTGRLASAPFARLLITDTFTQLVYQLTDEDAEAEGYERVEQLWDAIAELFGEVDMSATLYGARFDVVEFYDGLERKWKPPSCWTGAERNVKTG